MRQVYDELLGMQSDAYGSDAGLLLNTVLPKSYDALRWSLYAKVCKFANFHILSTSLTDISPSQGDVYYVHFFTPSPYQREYHGKAIPISRFNPVFDAPNPTLIAWHYAQAVRMRIRGYSVGMHGRPPGGKRARHLQEE
jgi:hypothetical protein